MSFATCRHSSRVGTTTSARGVPSSVGVPNRCSSGTPKPSVLPVPVRACPMTSSPARASGSVSSWMAKVRSMPFAASASTISGQTPSSANVGASAAEVVEAAGSSCGASSVSGSGVMVSSVLSGLPSSRLVHAR
jgi:hypothetical protein